MNWIKKNPAQLVLAIVALLMMAVAFVLYSNAGSFSEPFQAAHTSPSEDNKIPPTDLQIVTDRIASLEKPAEWTPKKGSLFISEKYLVKDGKLLKPTAEGPPLNPPVPNQYIIKNNLDITSSTVLTEDVDKDGFNLLWEYAGMDGIQSTYWPELEPDSTDPTKAESHPPYHVRLYLVKIHKVRFRLLFRAYDYDPKTKKCTIQINPLDRGGKTEFVEQGATVKGTFWKFESFILNEKGDKDESIANMVNTQNGQKLPLVYNQEGDSPESYAEFAYRWVALGGQPTKNFTKRKDETFMLDPEPEKNYKVIEIRKEEVDVLLPTGEKKTFPLIEEPPQVPPTPKAPK